MINLLGCRATDPILVFKLLIEILAFVLHRFLVRAVYSHDPIGSNENRSLVSSGNRLFEAHRLLCLGLKTTVRPLFLADGPLLLERDVILFANHVRVVIYLKLLHFLNSTHHLVLLFIVSINGNIVVSAVTDKIVHLGCLLAFLVDYRLVALNYHGVICIFVHIFERHLLQVQPLLQGVGVAQQGHVV